MKSIFKRLIIDSQERTFNDIIKRDIEIPLESQKIISLVGVRRSGKTSILFDAINTLRKKVSIKNIVYINFEDDRLFPITLKDLNTLIESYFELFPDKVDERVYLFLDEIQNVEHWEKFVRRIDDTLNVSIFITGSSAKLLSSEIATALRGRTLTYEIFPLSFKEYLRFRNIEINEHSSRSLNFIKNALEEYVYCGGFPETVEQPRDIRQRILRDYIDLIVYRDIVERYGVKNHALLKHVIKYSFSNISTLVSVTKLYNDLKSQGYKVSKDTLFDYFSMLNDAYAMFSIPIFRNSIREEQRNPKKNYAIDNGFKMIFSASVSKDDGKLYENTVFLQLRRQTHEVYYFKQKQEVDFYAVINQQKVLVNVSYDITAPETRKREINGLLEAMDYFNCFESYLITRDSEEIIEENRYTIKVIPLWKWLLFIDMP
jgi:predicted AAA+ superfamily ATPase